MLEYVDVVAVKPLGGLPRMGQILERSRRCADFADMIAEGGEMVEPLKDQAVFEGVYVHHRVPAWPNGFEIDATNLHLEMDEAGLLSTAAAAE